MRGLKLILVVFLILAVLPSVLELFCEGDIFCSDYALRESTSNEIAPKSFVLLPILNGGIFPLSPPDKPPQGELTL